MMKKAMSTRRIQAMKVTLKYLQDINACITREFERAFGDSVVLTADVIWGNPWFSSMFSTGLKPYDPTCQIIRDLKPADDPHRGNAVAGGYCSGCIELAAQWLKNVNEWEKAEGKELVL
jgi:hypothetical protein